MRFQLCKANESSRLPLRQGKNDPMAPRSLGYSGIQAARKGVVRGVRAFVYVLVDPRKGIFEITARRDTFTTMGAAQSASMLALSRLELDSRDGREKRRFAPLVFKTAAGPGPSFGHSHDSKTDGLLRIRS